MDTMDQENKIKELEEKIELFKEYIEFLNKAFEPAKSLAWVHGMRYSAEDISKGIEYRKKLGIEKVLEE